MSPAPPRALPEVWGGVECTVNRVGDRYFHQLPRSGHDRRVEDLELIAALGVKALRYPVLWELTAPDGPAGASWRWADERMARLRDLGIRPIVGLTHHGSGPRHTSLVDQGFVEGLSRFARAVAERYPWVEDFTPVNEPLTTARFSTLYGHWYPHHRDQRSFVRAVLVQCRAIAESMRAIREVTPGARLVQTEDMGRTWSTPRLAEEAEYQNQRRWLTLDLLGGRVVPGHPLWSALVEAGASEHELLALADAATPPDVIGLNYYATSDRWLDERLELYPAWSHGTSDRGPFAPRREVFADVEAVRARPEGVLGHRAVLEAAWQRYRLPVALTEVHLGSTRDEQLRWLAEAWRAACELRDEGADVRAITVWSLLGAFDWNTLVTAERGFYEPGAFDVRAPRPRATALARLTRSLSRGHEARHPALEARGWWRRPERLTFGPHAAKPGQQRTADAPRRRPAAASPVLVTGGGGTLGAAFGRLCEARGLEYVSVGRRDLDIAVADSVARVLDEVRPWAVVNAAGYVRVDDAERDLERCRRENATGPAVLAEACRARGLRLATFSSDLVFAGGRTDAYLEDDAPAPLNVYGRTKLEAERGVLSILPDTLVVRTSAFFGPWDRYNFIVVALRALAAGGRFRAAEDTIVSPTFVPDLVHATLDLLLDGEGGIWHLANAGAVSWAELARRAARLVGLDAEAIDGVTLADLGLAAPRPRFSALASGRGVIMPHLDDALARFLDACEVDGIRPGAVAGGGRGDGGMSSPAPTA